jgi:predicted nucleotidyltransferase
MSYGTIGVNTMNSVIQKELSTVLEAITSNTKIEDVFLFGSWAYGEPKPDSDLDVYLVIPDNGYAKIVATKFANNKRIFCQG